jgi:hypothetical protein
VIGSESAKSTSYHATPRVSTPGVCRFYALFRDFSHAGAASLDLFASGLRASNCCLINAGSAVLMLWLGSKLSRAEPPSRDQELPHSSTTVLYPKWQIMAGFVRL